MSDYLKIHPSNPEDRNIKQVVSVLLDGGVIVYPTDSTYALGCGTDFTQTDTLGPVYDHTGSNGRWWATVGLVPGLNVGALMVTNVATTAAQDATDEFGQLLVERLANSM